MFEAILTSAEHSGHSRAQLRWPRFRLQCSVQTEVMLLMQTDVSEAMLDGSTPSQASEDAFFLRVSTELSVQQRSIKQNLDC